MKKIKFKSLFYLTIAFLPTFLVSQGAACENSPDGSKFHIAPENVWITNNGIFLNLDHDTYEVNGVSSDEDGLYITQDNLMNAEMQLNDTYGLLWWKCPGCGFKNSTIYSTCQNPNHFRGKQ